MKSWEFFDTISGEAKFKFEARQEHFLQFLFRKIPWLEFRQFQGTIDGHVFLSKGQLVNNTKVTANGKIGANVGQLLIKGNSRFEFGSDGKSIAMSAAFHKVSLGDNKNKSNSIEGELLSLDLFGPQTQLLQLFEDVTLTADLPELRLLDAAALNLFIPKYTDLKISGGQGILSGKFTVSTYAEILPGHLRFRARNVNLDYKNRRLSSNVDLSVSLHDKYRGTEVFDIASSKIHLTNLRTANLSGWEGLLEFPNGEFSPTKNLLFKGRLDFYMTGLQPLFELFSVEGEDEWIKSTLELKKVKGIAHLTLGRDIVSIEDFNIKTDRMDFYGRLRFSEKEKKALTLIEMKLLNVGLKLENNETEIKIFGAKDWFNSQAPYPPLKISN